MLVLQRCRWLSLWLFLNCINMSRAKHFFFVLFLHWTENQKQFCSFHCNGSWYWFSFIYLIRLKHLWALRDDISIHSAKKYMCLNFVYYVIFFSSETIFFFFLSRIYFGKKPTRIKYIYSNTCINQTFCVSWDCYSGAFVAMLFYVFRDNCFVLINSKCSSRNCEFCVQFWKMSSRFAQFVITHYWRRFYWICWSLTSAKIRCTQNQLQENGINFCDFRTALWLWHSNAIAIPIFFLPKSSFSSGVESSERITISYIV